MSEEKKGKAGDYRFTVADDATGEPLKSWKVSRVTLLVGFITAAVVLFALFFALIAFTPARNLIPGYPDSRTKHDAISNALRIDSLENMILKWELYSENLSRVVQGKEPLPSDSLFSSTGKERNRDLGPKEISRNDSLLRAFVKAEGRPETSSSGAGPLPIEGMHFFIPVKGVVAQGFDKALHPYIDITAPGNSVVMSVLDGTVIQSGWSDEDGYTVRIQHDGDVISVYKHNLRLLKKTGDKVNAGTPIAIAGSSESARKDGHLHFELWHKGEAVDPEKFINF